MSSHQSRLTRIQEACDTWGAPRVYCWLAISISEQRLYCYHHAPDGWRWQRTYRVSTGKRPPSCIQNSYGTPVGLHQVSEKIGEGEPIGTVFVERVSTGKRYWESPEHAHGKQLITSRILRLVGLESGRNKGMDPETNQCCDTLDRFIYIHGMNFEYNIGVPSSQGCIGLTNYDMIDLYNRVPEDTLVWIEF